MKTSDIKGIIPPVITPLNNDPEQTVNHQALREQVERTRNLCTDRCVYSGRRMVSGDETVCEVEY